MYVYLTEHSLKQGDIIKVFLDEKDRTGQCLKVKDIVDKDTFCLEVECLGHELSELFVYGRQVDDFLDVDYNVITSLNVATIQDLRQRVKKIEEINENLLKRIEILENKL